MTIAQFQLAIKFLATFGVFSAGFFSALIRPEMTFDILNGMVLGLVVYVLWLSEERK